ASKSSLSSFANVTLYRGAMSSSSLYFEDDYNKYHTKIRMFKFYIVLVTNGISVQLEMRQHTKAGDRMIFAKPAKKILSPLFGGKLNLSPGLKVWL
ncbi:MAG: hypothetical protein L6365_13915, partial [Desulfobulbaceae bacterium]|nr:hypothetical protein [Pseudomonadota bacterium]MCG2748616.1 hypothetical protein [Desulfobulbaceae bacterium]